MIRCAQASEFPHDCSWTMIRACFDAILHSLDRLWVSSADLVVYLDKAERRRLQTNLTLESLRS